MHTILKLLLFGLFIYFMVNGFYKFYRLINEKIVGSRTLPAVVGFSLLLIFTSLVLFCAGVFSFLKLYEFLSLPE